MNNAWEISVGHLDGEGYMVEDRVALQGSDYNAPGMANTPLFIYANAKDDPVCCSGWDGSVSQVKTYHQKVPKRPGQRAVFRLVKGHLKTTVGYHIRDIPRKE